MDTRGAAILLTATAAAAAYWWLRQDTAGQGDPITADTGDGADPPADSGSLIDGAVSYVDNFFLNVGDTVTDRNVQAFLLLIRSGESSTGQGAYAMLWGGSHFADFSDHPRIYFQTPDGRKTSAAGAYQITATTWDALRRQLSLPDFSPASQDKAAIALIKGRGALADVIGGRFERAILKCQKEWTSLPGAQEAQYGMAEARRRLLAYGGQFDTSGTVIA